MNNVIIVEDDLDLAAMMIEIVQSHGAPTTHLPDGKNAIDFFSSNQNVKGIAFIDYQMPYFNGGEVIRFLADNNFFNLSKVFLFSALDPAHPEIVELTNSLEGHEDKFESIQKTPDSLCNVFEKIIIKFSVNKN